MATATKVDPQKVVTGPVRLSYANLLEPRAGDSDKPEDKKYSAMLLIPKSDTATINKIKKAQSAALEAGKSSKFGGKIPKTWRNTLRDADEELDLEKMPEAEGCMFMNVSNKTRPGVVDLNREHIDDPAEVYSGIWARVSLRAFPYDFNGTKGISFALNNVQKVRDDEALGGASSKAEDDFDDDFEGDSSEGEDLI